jgi:hypothetical protein
MIEQKKKRVFRIMNLRDTFQAFNSLLNKLWMSIKLNNKPNINKMFHKDNIKEKRSLIFQKKCNFLQNKYYYKNIKT